MPIQFIFHSSSFRQAAYIAFFCLILSAAAVFVSDKILNLVMTNHVRGLLFDEIKSREHQGVFASTDALINFFETQQSAAVRRSLYSFVFDLDGGLLYGNEDVLSGEERAKILTLSPSRLATLAIHQNNAELFGAALPLPDGGLYFISYDMLPMIQSTRIIPLMTGAGLFAMLFLILLISLPFGVTNLLKVNHLLKVLENYADGNHSVRVKDLSTRDEFSRLALEVNHMLGRTQKLMEEVRTINSHVGHELKTPLTRLKHRLHNAAEGVEGHVQDELDAATRELDRILYLFRAITRLTEVETGQCIKQAEDIAIDALLCEVGEYYEPLAEQHAIELKITAPNRQVLKGDRTLLFQAVANLLDNAIKYAPESKIIELKADMDGSSSRIRVIDQGLGIPSSELDVAPQRFKRLSGKEKVEGYGLGLPFVQAVAERHGGELVLTNVPSGGLEVIIVIRK